MWFSHQMPSHLFILLQRLPNVSFILIFLHLPHLFTFSLTLQLPFSLPFLHFFISHNLKLSFSPKLSLFYNGTQDHDQENLLRDFR